MQVNITFHISQKTHKRKDRNKQQQKNKNPYNLHKFLDRQKFFRSRNQTIDKQKDKRDPRKLCLSKGL